MELHVTESEVDGWVGIVRLKRPDRGNSWTTRMSQEYRWIMAGFDRDPGVRVILVTGSGRQFCVGADFKALAHHAAAEDDYVEQAERQVAERPGYGVDPRFDNEMVWHWGLRKPVIAAINGACAGIAVALAAFCDLRYGAAAAKLTTSTPRLGLPAEYGLSWILPRLVGLTHAADLLLSGRVFMAEEARDMGFLNAVLPAEGFEDAVREIARGLAATSSPAAVLAAKRQLYADLLSDDVSGAIQQSKVLTGQSLKMPDFQEAMQAMREKRAPRFAGLPAPAA